MTNPELDEFLATLRKHRVRAMAMKPDGTLTVELEPQIDEMGSLVDVPEAVAGGWKRPAALSED